MKLLLILSTVSLLLAACGKSEDSSSSSDDGGGSGSSAKADSPGDQPWDDTSKPYLDDKKLGDFLQSLKDPNGPFDTINKGKVTAFNAGQRMDEFDAAARKSGFKSGEEYLGVWMRIMTANTALQQQAVNESMARMNEETIKTQQEMIKNPDATPEMKKAAEENIKAARETLEMLKQSTIEGVNKEDLAVFKKHQPAFEEAMKKWTK